MKRSRAAGERLKKLLHINEGKKRGVFWVLLLSYLATMLISMLGSYGYIVEGDASAREAAMRGRTTMLEQYLEELNHLNSDVQKIAHTMLFNNTFELYLHNAPIYSEDELQEDLRALAPDDRTIIDYYAYLGDTNMVVTPTIRMVYERFARIMYEYQGEEASERRARMQSEYYMSYYEPAKEVLALSNRKESVITYIQTAPLGTKTPLAQIVVLLDAQAMRQRMERIVWASDGAQLYLLNKQGEVVLRTEGAPELRNEQAQSYAASGAEQETLLRKEKLVVRSASDAQSGWSVLMTIPTRVYHRSITKLRIKFVIQILLMTALGLAAVIYFTRRNYKPIQELAELVGGEEEAGKDEFESIRFSIQRNIEQRRELGERLDASVPTMRSDLLGRLLLGLEPVRLPDGTAETGELERLGEELRQLNFVPKSEYFLAIALSLDTSSAFFVEEGAYPDINLSLGRLICENIALEMLQGVRMVAHMVNQEKNLVVFVINLENEDVAGGKQTVDELFEVFASILEENFALRYFAGVSEVHRGLRQLRECMDEARKSLEHGMFNGKYGLTHYENIAGLEYDYYYPIEQEIQLANFLKVGDAASAKELIDTIYEVNFAERKIGSLAGRCLIVELGGTLAKVMNNMLAQSGQNMQGENDVLRSVLAAGSYEESREELMRTVDAVCELSQKKQNNQTERLVDRIEDFIKNSEEWLDLATIAGKFDITPQYLSTVFKKYKNENVKEYISKIRLEKAKELLATSTLTVDEIARRLGYANETGLNRLFKKYEGITPGAYRTSMRGRKGY